MNKRILIIGGVAGGASVAARARRLDAGAEIIMFERGQHVSFSNCALPYYLSGVVGNSDALVMMSPEKFKKSYDIDARVNSEVMAINRDKKTIEIKNTLTGDIHEEAYDVLVMAPGASPVKPRSIGGIDGKNVYTVRNVADIVHLKDGLEAAGAENTAVIGGGFIGIEVAENLRELGIDVTLVEAAVIFTILQPCFSILWYNRSAKNTAEFRNPRAKLTRIRIPGWNISHSLPPTRFARTVPTTLLTVSPIEILKLRRRSSAASAKHSTLTLM